MTDGYSELRRLAEAAQDAPTMGNPCNIHEFRRATEPAAILSLIGRHDELQRSLDLRDQEVVDARRDLSDAIKRAEKAEAEAIRQKVRGDNHAETLRGIARMPVGDGERMQLWARDGLSGHTEPVEATLLALSDERNSLRARAEAAEARVAALEETLTSAAETFADVARWVRGMCACRADDDYCDRLDAALKEAREALASAAPTSGWRPIETAPDMETRVLVYYPRMNGFVDHITICTVTQDYVMPANSGTFHWRKDCQGLMWMPLPATPAPAPTEASQDTEGEQP